MRFWLFAASLSSALLVSACTVSGPEPSAPNVDDNGNPIGGDTVDPIVSINTPSNGSVIQIGDAVLVEGSASDNVAVTAITTSATGLVQGTPTGATVSWSFVVDTSALPSGTFTVDVSARDAAGNSGTASVTFTLVAKPIAIAELSGLPVDPTAVTTLDVTVAGEHVTQYKYSLDGSPFSTATPIVTHITASGLGDGSHTLSVVGGNADDEFQPEAEATTFTWRIDLTGPVVSLSSPVALSNATAQQLTASLSTAEPVTYQYQVKRVGPGCADDPQQTEQGSGDLTIAVDQRVCDGTYTVEVTATDALGNMSPITSRTLVVDRTAPNFTLSAAPAQAVTGSSRDFTATSGESLAFAWTIAYANCASSNATGSGSGTNVTISIDQTPCDGLVTLTVSALDAAQNAAANATRSYTVDRTAPSLTVSTPPAATNTATTDLALSSAESVTFNYTITYSNSSCSTVTSSATGSAASVTIDNDCDGTVTFSVTATDSTTNTSAAQTRTYTVDRTAPLLAVSPVQGALTNPTRANQVDFTATTTDGELVALAWTITRASCGGGVDGSIASSNSQAITVLNTGCDGLHTLTVTATDALGNVASQTRSYTVDRTPPSFALSPLTPDSPTNEASSLFTATTSPSESATFAYTVDYASCAASNTSGSISGSSGTITVNNTFCDGVVTLSVWATDALGNQTSSATTRTYSVVTQGPAFTFTPSPAPSPTNAASTDFVLTASAGQPVDYEYSIAYANCPAFDVSNGTANDVVSTTITVTNAGRCDGLVTVQARALDALANASPYLTRTYLIDRTSPTFTLSLAPSTPTNAASTTFTANGASEPVAYTWSIDRASCADGSGSDPDDPASILVSNDCDGLVALTVTATDAAGNATSLSRTYTVDRTPPTFTLSAAPVSATNAAQTTFSASAPSESVGYSWTIDRANCADDTGNAPTPTDPQNIVIDNNCDGSTTLAVTATDQAGNTLVLSRSYQVDRTAPALTVSTPAARTASANLATVNVTATTSVPAESVSWEYDVEYASCSANNYSGTLNDTALSVDIVTRCEGLVTFRVRATDAAGNASAYTTRTYTVDRTVSFTLDPNPATDTRASSTDFTVASLPAEAVQTISWNITRAGVGCPAVEPGSHSGSSHTISVLNTSCDGNYTLSVTVTDDLGNTASLSRTYVVDRTPPTFTLSAAPSNPTNSATTDFTVTAPSEPLSLSWTIDRQNCADGSGSNGSPSYPATISVANPASCDGTVTLDVTATDALGNTSSQQRVYSIDQTAPSFTLNTPPARTRAAQTLFTASSPSESISTYEYSVTKSCAGTTTGSAATLVNFAVDNTCEGSYSIQVRAIDLAGNVSGYTTRTYAVDNSVSFTLTPNVANNTNSASTSFTANSTGEFVQSIAWSITRTGVGCPALPETDSFSGAVHTFAVDNTVCDGSYQVDVTVTDDVGNTNTQTRTYAVDRTAPTFTLSASPSNPTRLASTDFTATAPSEAISLSWTIDRQNCADGSGSDSSPSYPATISVANPASCDGTVTLDVTATDDVGNTNTQQRTYVIDQTAPTFSLTTPPSRTKAAQTLFTASSPSETIATYDYSFTRSCGAGGSGSGASLSNLAVDNNCDGNYSFSVTATDLAGNVSATITRTYEVDNAVSFTLSPDPAVDSNAASSSFDVSSLPAEHVVLIEWTITRTCTNTSSSVAAADHTIVVDQTPCLGAYSLQVTVTDDIGNQAVQTRSYNVLLDLGSATFIAGPDDDINNPTRFSTVEWILERTKPAATHFAYSLDSDPLGPLVALDGFGRAKLRVGGALLAGPHVVHVCMSDGVTIQATCTDRNFAVDDDAPVSPIIDSGPAAQTSDYEQAFAFTIAANTEGVWSLTRNAAVVDTGVLPSGSQTLRFSALSNANYVLSIHSRERSGRTSLPVTHSFEINRTSLVFDVTQGLFPVSNWAMLAVGPELSWDVVGASYRYKIDEGSYSADQANPSSFAIDVSTGGWHTVRVEGFDAYGNTGYFDHAFFAAETELFVSTGGSDLNDCDTPLTACQTLARALLQQPTMARVIKMARDQNHVVASSISLPHNVLVSGGWESDFSAHSGFANTSFDDTAMSGAAAMFECQVGAKVGMEYLALNKTSDAGPAVNASSACGLFAAMNNQFTGGTGGAGAYNVLYLDGANQIHISSNGFTNGAQALVMNGAATAGVPTAVRNNSFTGQDYALVTAGNRSVQSPVRLYGNTFTSIRNAAMTATFSGSATNNPLRVTDNTVLLSREGVALYQPTGVGTPGINALILRNSFGAEFSELASQGGTNAATGVRFNNEVDSTTSSVVVALNTIRVGPPTIAGTGRCLFRGVVGATHVLDNFILVKEDSMVCPNSELIGVTDTDDPFLTSHPTRGVGGNAVTVQPGTGLLIARSSNRPEVFYNQFNWTGGYPVVGDASVIAGNAFDVGLGAINIASGAGDLRVSYNTFSIPAGMLAPNGDLHLVGNTFTSTGPTLTRFKNLLVELNRHTAAAAVMNVSFNNSASGSARVLHNFFDTVGSDSLLMTRTSSSSTHSLVIAGNMFGGRVALNGTVPQPISQLTNNTFAILTGQPTALELENAEVLQAFNNLFVYMDLGPADQAVRFTGATARFDGAANTFNNFAAALKRDTGLFAACGNDDNCTPAEMAAIQYGSGTFAAAFADAIYQLDIPTSDCSTLVGGVMTEEVVPATQSPLEVRSYDGVADRTIASGPAACGLDGGWTRGYRERD